MDESDAGFRNWVDELDQRGVPESVTPRTPDAYRDELRMREKDEQQMIDMGR